MSVKDCSIENEDKAIRTWHCKKCDAQLPVSSVLELLEWLDHRGMLEPLYQADPADWLKARKAAIADGQLSLTFLRKLHGPNFVPPK